jgi:hypothetical protein
MTNYPCILFNKSLLQCRNLGAQGGRAHGRNLRARRALLPPLPPPAAVPWRAAPQETTAQAIAVLDTHFPWLRGAEKRLPRRLPGRALRAVPAPRTATPGNRTKKSSLPSLLQTG